MIKQFDTETVCFPNPVRFLTGGREGGREENLHVIAFRISQAETCVDLSMSWEGVPGVLFS